MGTADRVRVNTMATASSVTDGGATETVVLTSNGVSTPQAGCAINLSGVVCITAGASTTAVVVTVRRGTVTGHVVGVAETDTLAATKLGVIPFDFTDSPGDIDGAVYVVTVTETGASGDGTVTFASIQATIS